jgi:DNA-binding transcriptional MerR regulator
MKFQTQKVFYSIKEVAEMFNVEESTLRYWEKEFSTIRPERTAKGIRQYRQSDIEEIRTVHHLVKDQGMTLAGTKKKLTKNRPAQVQKSDVIDRLRRVRNELESLKTKLDEVRVA